MHRKIARLKAYQFAANMSSSCQQSADRLAPHHTGLDIERLYRLRFLHRGKHRVQSSAQLLLHLWLSLSRPRATDSS